jgi:hypothetical protein
VLTAGLAVGLVFTSGVAVANAAEPDLVVTGLRTDGRVNPLGIGLSDPTFSWYNTATSRGTEQTGYELEVSKASDVVWSTGRVNDDEQLNVVYDGPALTDQSRYSWRVKTWDNHENESAWSDAAWFETGLSTWTGDWISAPSNDAELARWNDYTVTTNFTLDANVIGVYFRGVDTRSAYMWQLNTSDGTNVMFRPHKAINGGIGLIESKNVSNFISRAALLTGTHELKISAIGSTITTWVDGIQIDQRTESQRLTGYVGFRQAPSQQGPERATIHDMSVVKPDGTVLFSSTFDGSTNPFTVGRVANGNLIFDADGDGFLNTAKNLPIFRKEFTPDAAKTVASARIYAAARGVYELSLNGEKVGDQHLAPGWTNYNSRIQYQTYDVTDQLDGGANAIGAYLAPGWYSGNIASFGNNKYGNTPSLIAQLRIDYTDGSSEWVSTNNTWKTTSGPIKSSDIIDGETFDASATPSGWDHAGFDATAWSAPGIQPTASSKLTPQLDEPVRQTEEKPAKSMTQTVSGRYVYDLEQNMVGVARLRLTGVAGQTVKIRYGEVVNPDKSLYVANLRSAKVTDYYTFKTTGVEVYEPKFTYHGYRFIEVSGVTTVPALTDITGLVWGSDMETTGTLETSNALLNQLQSNITWGQRGNFLSIPTDTPARDERLGWTGDINVFAQTAAYNSNTHGFLSKWLIDLKETQGSNGDLPGVAPYTDCCGGGVGWSDAGITVPYSLFKAYGDTAVVRDNWDMMDKFMDYVIAEAGADNIGTRGAYLDWLHLDDPTAANVLSTAYNAEDARMLSEMAAAIGETARAEELAQLSLDIRAAFASAFIAANGTVSGNSQTGYAMALGMGMVPADKVQAVGDKFIAKLAVTDYHLTTGFLGTPWLLPALTASGHNDIAYRMLLHTDYPSWGYEVANGATTIWERWNSIMPDGSFGDVNMNSFNHYAYGAVGTWMYQNIGGIAPLSEGYKTFRIAPVVGGGLTSGTGEFASVYGDISSKWETTDNGLTLDVTVPVGTTATVELPANSEWAVSEGGKLLDQVEGVTDVTSTDGLVTVTVGSGTYEFVVDERGATLGAVFVALDSYRAEIARLEGLGDLSAGQADAFEESLDGIATSVETALLAIIESGDILSPLLVAVDDVAALETEVSAAGLDDTVEGLLLDENDAVDSLLGSVVSQLLGVSAAIAPVAGSPLAGDDVEAAVSLANTGTAAVTDLSATIAIEGGWSVEPARLERATLAANSTGSLAFATTVPSDAEVGQVDATLDLAYRYGTHEIHVSSTSRLLTVASPIAISTATAAVTSAGTAEVTVVVANTGSTGVSGRVELDVPEGWAAAIPSSDVTVGANDTATIVVPLFVPATVNEQSFTIGTSFVRGGTILDERDAALAVALTRSPADPIDWVDLGNPTAEASRAILHSGNSGTNTEAGLTRRYSNATTPGSWFSFTITVPVNQPYVIRATETYDSVATKKYDIKIDGQTVYTRQNTSKGAGTQTFDALVTTPSATSTVRLEMRYTTEPGFHDPSIADVWTLAAPADLAPLTSANVTSSGPTGANGWVRGPATVTVNAADDSGIAPTLEVDAGAGWGAYTAPVTVTAQGTTTIGYRATDANSHVTARKDATVKLDSIAPTTTALTEVSAEVASLDHATVTFTATDATSGVAATRYRIDGGSWATASAEPISIEGFGEHLVEYYSTDVAGNVGLIERAEVSIDDVDGVAALVAPVVSGTAKFGKTLSTTTGLWNTTGLTFSYQWLRNGIEISNATASSYVVRSNDGGKKVSVRVTATKTGLAAGVAVSNSTATVPKVTLLKNTKRATITGSAKPGSTLKAGKGSWNVKSLSYSYQWYRNSVAIDGATASSYKVTVADSGAKITVKVGASKSLYEPVYSTAVSKVIVKRAAVTSFTAYPTTVASGAVSTLAITVASNGLVPTGTVAIYDGSKKIGSVALVDGTATYEFSSTKKGSHALLAKYLGSTQIAADSSVRRTIRVN